MEQFSLEQLPDGVRIKAVGGSELYVPGADLAGFKSAIDHELGISRDPSPAVTCTPAPARASTQSDAEVSAIQDPVGDRPRVSEECRCERCQAGTGIRREVYDFAISMENKLLENDHKAHWLKAGDAPFFLKRLWGEIEELEDAMLEGMSPDMVEAEAADVACFAMFVAQRTRQDFEGDGK